MTNCLRKSQVQGQNLAAAPTDTVYRDLGTTARSAARARRLGRIYDWRSGVGGDCQAAKGQGRKTTELNHSPEESMAEGGFCHRERALELLAGKTAAAAPGRKIIN